MNDRAHPRAAQVIELVALSVAALALTLNRGFYEQLTNNVFFSLTLAACAAVFLSLRRLKEFPQAVGVGIGLSALQWVVLKVPAKVLPVVALIGFASWLLLAARRILFLPARQLNDRQLKERQLLQDAIVPPFLFLLLGYFGSGPLELTGRLHPKTFDRFLYSFDQSLGVQMSFAFGRMAWRSRLLLRGLLAFYYLLPIAILTAYARQLVRNRDRAMTAFLAFALAGPLGVVFYNLLPACGPEYLFGAKFPFEPLTVIQFGQLPLETVAIAGVRNAFPSLHLAWALLIFWYSKGMSRLAQLAFFVFVVGTACATLGLGEHYFVDLVVAFPYALLVYAICALHVSIFDRRRAIPIAAGLILLLAWVALLRWGGWTVVPSPVVPWLLVAATVGLSLFLQARLRAIP
jgi:hypothetical protein